MLGSRISSTFDRADDLFCGANADRRDLGIIEHSLGPASERDVDGRPRRRGESASDLGDPFLDLGGRAIAQRADRPQQLHLVRDHVGAGTPSDTSKGQDAGVARIHRSGHELVERSTRAGRPPRSGRRPGAVERRDHPRRESRFVAPGNMRSTHRCAGRSGPRSAPDRRAGPRSPGRSRPRRPRPSPAPPR